MDSAADAAAYFTRLSSDLARYAAAVNAAGFREWGRHLQRDADVAAMRALRIREEHAEETADVDQFIQEAQQANTSDPVIDQRELAALETAIDALEQLHNADSAEPVRDCLCSEASAWRHARHVTRRLRSALGLRERLLDRV